MASACSATTSSGHIRQQATLLKSVAKHWVKVDEPHLDQLRMFCRRLDPKHSGMTDRNRERLRPFEDANNIEALVRLPDRIVAEVKRTDRGRRSDALRVADALAIRLSTFVMLRSANLRGLVLGKHIVRIGTDLNAKVFIVIPAAEVKNNVDLEAELPPPVVELLDLFCREYRPRLLNGPSDLLFPGRDGRPSSNVVRRVPGVIRRHLGLTFNMHLFRHLAGLIHLREHPGDYVTVRRVLGHKSLATTTRAYIGLETADAYRHYDRSILSLMPRRPKS